jgi:hypothetical protein
LGDFCDSKNTSGELRALVSKKLSLGGGGGWKLRNYIRKIIVAIFEKLGLGLVRRKIFK